jgi:hypothetical protein
MNMVVPLPPFPSDLPPNQPKGAGPHREFEAAKPSPGGDGREMDNLPSRSPWIPSRTSW